MLAGMLCFYPYLQADKAGQTIFEVLFTAMLFLSTYILCDTRNDTIVALIFGIPTVGAHVTQFFFPELIPPAIPMALFVLFYVHMTLSVFRHVLRENTVDSDIIAGSVCTYLLFGMIWAMMFTFVEEMQPGSFQLAFQDGPLTPDGSTPHFTFFLYFSFTTLTTLGYGDILPMTPAARSLSSIEVITGVLYIGAFVARLISAYDPKKIH